MENNLCYDCYDCGDECDNNLKCNGGWAQNKEDVASGNNLNANKNFF